jgi:hypothetical protein
MPAPMAMASRIEFPEGVYSIDFPAQSAERGAG